MNRLIKRKSIMPQASKSGTKSTKTPDAIQLLTAEHKEVDTLFKEYENRFLDLFKKPDVHG